MNEALYSIPNSLYHRVRLMILRPDNHDQVHMVRAMQITARTLIFDILIRPAPELSTEERNDVKKVARELL